MPVRTKVQMVPFDAVHDGQRAPHPEEERRADSAVEPPAPPPVRA
jgi:hypothetical protein